MIRPLFNINGGVAAEPYFVESFKAGYESAGGTWANSVSAILEGYVNINAANLSGYNVYCNNYSGWQDYIYDILRAYNKLKMEDSMLCVVPAGSNYPQYYWSIEHSDAFVVCGSGKYVNQSAYSCDFFDIDPYGGGDTPITYIYQGGKQYTIAYINRTSSSTIVLGISANFTDLGFEHGVPIRISALSGTNISPLPSGLKWLTYAGYSSTSIGEMHLTATTTAGTIGSNQAVTSGIIKLGTSDSNTFFRMSSVIIPYSDYGIYIKDVEGFANNPNGLFSIIDANTDGYWNKFEIAHQVGSGAYSASGLGTARVDTESYSTPYIAGKLSYIKDTLNCSWWEVKYRAQKTSSFALTGNQQNKDFRNGYGLIDVRKAINYKGEIPPDPYIIPKINTLSSSFSNYGSDGITRIYRISFNAKNNISYEYYTLKNFENPNSLSGTLETSSWDDVHPNAYFTDIFQPVYKQQSKYILKLKNVFEYQSTTGEFEIKYFKYKKIKIKKTVRRNLY